MGIVPVVCTRNYFTESYPAEPSGSPGSGAHQGVTFAMWPLRTVAAGCNGSGGDNHLITVEDGYDSSFHIPPNVSITRAITLPRLSEKNIKYRDAQLAG